MFLLTIFVLPLASLALGLWTWRLTHKRGWDQILPISSRYVAFYCISTTLFMGLYYSSLYPGSMQATICLWYSYGYSSVQIVTILFVLAVMYELLTYTSRNRAEIQARIIVIIGAMAVAGAVVLAIENTRAIGAPDYCVRLASFSNALAKPIELIVVGMFVAMIVLKIGCRLRWGSGISLILLGLVQFFMVDSLVSGAIANDGQKTVSDIVSQISSFTWLVLWWLAVRQTPNIPAAQPRAAAVPHVNRFES